MLEYVDYFYFTRPQYLSIFSVGILSCTLSICGSFTILFLLWKAQHRVQELYHRLVLGMSIADLIVTFGLLLQPFLLPKETNFPFAVGNQTTCNILGFIAPFFAASYCYSCFLGLYFMMMVTQNRKEKEIAKLIEPWVHVLAFGFPLAYSILCLSLDLINPNPYLGICNTVPYPIECTFPETNNNEEYDKNNIFHQGQAENQYENVECIRSEWARKVVPIHGVVSLLYVLIGMVSTWLVYWKVRRQGQIMARYSVDGRTSENLRKREKAVANQAIYFAAACLVGFVVLISVEVLKAVYAPQIASNEGIGDLEDHPAFFAVLILVWLTFPLQGFLNCLVYIRPRYIRWRNYFPEKSCIWCIRMILSGETQPEGYTLPTNLNSERFRLSVLSRTGSSIASSSVHTNHAGESSGDGNTAAITTRVTILSRFSHTTISRASASRYHSKASRTSFDGSITNDSIASASIYAGNTSNFEHAMSESQRSTTSFPICLSPSDSTTSRNNMGKRNRKHGVDMSQGNESGNIPLFVLPLSDSWTNQDGKMPSVISHGDEDSAEEELDEKMSYTKQTQESMFDSLKDQGSHQALECHKEIHETTGTGASTTVSVTSDSQSSTT